MAEEIIYLSDELVTITSSRAILAGTTYALPNITSVRSWRKKRSLWPVLLGALFIVVGLRTVTVDTAAWQGALVWTLLGVSALLWHFLVRKDKHFVKIGTAAGEADAIVADDPSYINGVVNALNEAIAHR